MPESRICGVRWVIFRMISGKSSFCTSGENSPSRKSVTCSVSVRTQQRRDTGMRWQGCEAQCWERRIFVRTPDDEQFEAYLKRFQPIAPEPVPTVRGGGSSRRLPSPGRWLAAVAAFLVSGALVLQVRTSRVVVLNRSGDAASAVRLRLSEPLTMQSADAWLATAPSLKAAVDGLAFRPGTSPVPQGKQSAVAVLSKEKIRL